MKGIVLDCSVCGTWFFSDEHNQYGNKVLDMLVSVPAYVPSIWTLELTNIWLVGERRKRSTQADTKKWSELISSLPITVEEISSLDVFNSVLHLARIYNLSSYDASYLELAMRKCFSLATLDKKLKAAAKSAGVPLV